MHHNTYGGENRMTKRKKTRIKPSKNPKKYRLKPKSETTVSSHGRGVWVKKKPTKATVVKRKK